MARTVAQRRRLPFESVFEPLQQVGAKESSLSVMTMLMRKEDSAEAVLVRCLTIAFEVGGIIVEDCA